MWIVKYTFNSNAAWLWLFKMDPEYVDPIVLQEID